MVFTLIKIILKKKSTTFLSQIHIFSSVIAEPFNIFFFNLDVLLSFASSFRKIPLQLMDLLTTEMISWTRKIKKTNQCLLFNIPAAAAAFSQEPWQDFQKIRQLLCVCFRQGYQI